MKRKVIIVLIILAVIAGGVFALNKTRQSKDILAALEEESITQQDLSEAKLTFYFEGAEAKSTREVLDEIEKKTKKQLNIKLDFKFNNSSPESYIDRVKSVITSGQPCDAFFYASWMEQGLKSLANENLIMDISDIFPQYAPNYFEKFSKEEINAVSVDKKIYAIPNRLPTTQMRCALVREDLMEKYNISDIKNYGDYEVYLKAVKENEPNLNPMAFYETAIGLFAEANGYVVMDYRQGLVYKWDDPNTKILAWEQTPEFSKGIRTIQGWYDKGYLLKDLGIAHIDESLVTSGRWASFIVPLGSEFNYNSALKKKGLSYKYKAYPLYPDRTSERDTPLNGAMVFNAKSSNIERVMMFLNWLYSKQDNYDSLMYGIEGKHYNLQNDQIKLPEDTTDEDFYPSWSWRWPLENIDYERVDSSSSVEDVKAYNKIINEKTQFPPHMGFVPDYGAVIDIATFRALSFSTIEQKIYTEVLKQEDIDSYIKEQKDNGVTKLINEVQKQFDTWKSENK